MPPANVRVVVRGERDLAISRDYAALGPLACLSAAHDAAQQFEGDISGTCRGQLHTKCRECPTVIQAHSPNHRAFRNAECYGGCGGNYINSSRILALEGYQNLLEAILRAWGGPVPQDVLLSSVILADGGTIGDNPGYYELGDLPPGFSNTKYGPLNIFHSMKWLYFMKYIVD